MNISVIGNSLNSYSGYRDADVGFGAYDANKLVKPEAGKLNVDPVSSRHSHIQVEKAVDTMKRDQVLHKYQKFVGERTRESFVGRGITENFTL